MSWVSRKTAKACVIGPSVILIVPRGRLKTAKACVTGPNVRLIAPKGRLKTARGNATNLRPLANAIAAQRLNPAMVVHVATKVCARGAQQDAFAATLAWAQFLGLVVLK